MNLSPAFSAQRGKSYGVEHFLATSDGTLTEVLSESLRLDENRSLFLLTMGAIYCNGSRLNSLYGTPDIKKGDYLRVHRNPRRFPVQVLDPNSILIYEDSDVWVVDKPAGLPVHATVDNTQENLLFLLSQHFNKEFLITHRLDVGTQGLLILAKNKLAQKEINQLLMQGQIKKKYRAIVHGRNIPLGLMTHYMESSPRAPKQVSTEAHPGWAQCQLRVLQQSEIASESKHPDVYSEVLIELITGRTHQIRAQLSAAGFPIKGDIAYGSPLKLSEHEFHCLRSDSLQVPPSFLRNEALNVKGLHLFSKLSWDFPV